MKLLLVGSGNMGQALINKWWEKNAICKTSIIINSSGKALANLPLKTIKASANTADIIPNNFNPDLCVAAIKPQICQQLASYNKRFAQNDWLSVMAGISIKQLETTLKTPNITRAMPNLAAEYNASISCVFSSDAQSSSHEKSMTLLKLCGETITLNQEQDINAFTAICGSGPAYFYLLCEMLEKTAQAEGFSPQQAKTMAQGTLVSAARLLENNPQINARQLRKQITSPQGVTEAAITELNKNDAFEKLLAKTINAAKTKSQKLGS